MENVWGQGAGAGAFRQDISKILKISKSDGASLFVSLCGHNHKQGPKHTGEYSRALLSKGLRNYMISSTIRKKGKWE